MKRFMLYVILVAIGFATAGTVEAKGRTGSHRMGGHTSHGKGSHYIGGRR